MYLHVSLFNLFLLPFCWLTMWIAEAFERVENISVEKLHLIVKTQGMLDDLIETNSFLLLGYTNSPFRSPTIACYGRKHSEFDYNNAVFRGRV